MVSFTDLNNLSETSGIEGFLSIPTAGYPFFWGWILLGIWLIAVSTIYFKEKERTGRGKILGAMAVSAFAIIVLAVAGTISGFITNEIMVYTLTLGMLIIAIWFFTND